ncbi:hypothetical protein [Streptomyces mangrovi]|uniref:hypothetical protein n=1 Tax=Streptomyces mangrovi TaxID=1206892 RepID=UPI00399D26BE
MWSELLSGFVGAFLGAVATYWAARSQTTRILEADREARLAVAEQERLLMREADSRAAASEALDALYQVYYVLPRMRDPLQAPLSRNQGSGGAETKEALDGLKRSVRVTAARLESKRLRQLLESASGVAAQYAYMSPTSPTVLSRAQQDVDAYLTWAQKCLHRYLDTGEDVLANLSQLPRPHLLRDDAEAWQPPPL